MLTYLKKKLKGPSSAPPKEQTGRHDIYDPPGWDSPEALHASSAAAPCLYPAIPAIRPDPPAILRLPSAPSIPSAPPAPAIGTPPAAAPRHSAPTVRASTSRQGQADEDFASVLQALELNGAAADETIAQLIQLQEEHQAVRLSQRNADAIREDEEFARALQEEELADADSDELASCFARMCSRAESAVPDAANASDAARASGTARDADYDEHLCQICCSEPKTTAFLHGDSAHKCACRGCAEVWFRDNRTCPICRVPATSLLNVHDA